MSTDTDTSAEAVERLARFHARRSQQFDYDKESSTADTLRALLAVRRAARDGCSNAAAAGHPRAGAPRCVSSNL